MPRDRWTKNKKSAIRLKPDRQQKPRAFAGANMLSGVLLQQHVTKGRRGLPRALRLVRSRTTGHDTAISSPASSRTAPGSPRLAGGRMHVRELASLPCRKPLPLGAHRPGGAGPGAGQGRRKPIKASSARPFLDVQDLSGVKSIVRFFLSEGRCFHDTSVGWRGDMRAGNRGGCESPVMWR